MFFKTLKNFLVHFWHSQRMLWLGRWLNAHFLCESIDFSCLWIRLIYEGKEYKGILALILFIKLGHQFSNNNLITLWSNLIKKNYLKQLLFSILWNISFSLVVEQYNILVINRYNENIS